MNKSIQNKLSISYYFYFSITPLLCILLDMFMSTINPDSEYGTRVENFDFSIINQSIYYSVWCSLATSIWAILNFINYYNKKMPKWVTGKNSTTFITTANFIVFGVFVFTFSFMRGTIVGFDTWYKITKSVVEHFINPPLIVLFYFLYNHDKTYETSEYAKSYGWYTLIMPCIYLIYIIVRCLMINTYANPSDAFTPFPYDQIDPYSKNIYIFLLGITSFIIGHYCFGILFNYLSNLTYKEKKAY